MEKKRISRYGKTAARAGLVLAAGVLSFFLGYYNFGHDGYGNPYYTAALRSMAQSWHNFFFVSFDPAGFLSVDKPPVALWVEALFVRLFGFHPAIILLPGALAAAASVLVLQRTVQRAFGYWAGFASAAALAVTPVFVAASRSNNPDAIFALLLVLAAWAALHAAEAGSLRWFLAAAVFLGLAFNTKTLVACLVLPACGLAFLCARLPRRRLAAWIALSGAVFVAVSFAWIAAVDRVPASQRPFVGSSQKNTEFDLTFGYNGFNRVFAKRGAEKAMHRDAAVRTLGVIRHSADTANDTNGRSAPGALRLFAQPFGDQVAWLMAFAFAGTMAAAAALLLESRKKLRVDAAPGDAALSVRPALIPAGASGSCGKGASEYPAAPDAAGRRLRLASLLLWGGWAVVTTVFFSFYRELTHRYYLNILAPAIAALCGIGLISAVKLARHFGKGYVLFLPGLFLFGGILQIHLLGAYPAWRSLLWVFPALAVLLGAAAGTAAFAPRRVKLLRGLVPGLAGAAFCCLLAVPLMWSLMAVAGTVAGADAAAGPSALGRTETASRPSLMALLKRLDRDDTAAPTTSPGERGLEEYLKAHRGGAEYLVASQSTEGSQDFVIDTGEPVMAIGGFNGANPILTLSQFQTLVGQGKVRYFWEPAIVGLRRAHAEQPAKLKERAGQADRSLRTQKTAVPSAEGNGGSVKTGSLVNTEERAKAAQRVRADSAKKRQRKKILSRGAATDAAIVQWVRENAAVVPRGDYAAGVVGAPGVLYRLLPGKDA